MSHMRGEGSDIVTGRFITINMYKLHVKLQCPVTASVRHLRMSITDFKKKSEKGRHENQGSKRKGPRSCTHSGCEAAADSQGAALVK